MCSVVVVGNGVQGLSCAIRLAEAGFDVHVVAPGKPEVTTSAGVSVRCGRVRREESVGIARITANGLFYLAI